MKEKDDSLRERLRAGIAEPDWQLAFLIRKQLLLENLELLRHLHEVDSAVLNQPTS